MKLVVYGPDRRLGALDDDGVIDLNSAYARYLKERENEPLPYEMAAAIVPAELGAFIESGQRALDGAQRAIEHVVQEGAEARGLRGERLIEPRSEVKIHAPYARRARIMMAGGNYIVHSQGMSLRGADGERMGLDDVYKQSRAKGIWGFYCFPENAAGPDEEVIYPARTDRLDHPPMPVDDQLTCRRGWRSHRLIGQTNLSGKLNGRLAGALSLREEETRNDRREQNQRAYGSYRRRRRAHRNRRSR